ncbi:MAG: Permease of the major facilitator superfamily [Bacteroidetes bacterium]|nr:Permease of the major facilitator superfamily [Bacteroidota bacterium]
MDHLKSNPMYRYLMILGICASAGLQGWTALFTNFAKEMVGVNGFQIGLSQAVREIPGFLSVAAVYLLFVFKEHRLSAWSVVLLGIGIAITGIFTSFGGLLTTTFIMSVGFHFFETTNKSLTVQYFNITESPVVFARLRGYGALANIAVGFIIWVLSFILPYMHIFLILGLFIGVSGISMLFTDPVKQEIPHQHKKLVFKRKYWLFYVLNFLAGTRRQIFTVFAIFLLVDRYNLGLRIVTGIYAINYALTYLLNPQISRALNKYGERVVLSLESASLIVLFLGYAFIDNVWIVAGLFILDSIFFNFSIGLNTYLQKTADPEDLGSSTAVGFTINHISAVIIPVFGGVLWMLNWRLPFLIGTAFALLSLFFTQMITTGYHKKRNFIFREPT